MAHHILQCDLREEITLPESVSKTAANRFVETVIELRLIDGLQV
jgi:hypothetical protein